MTAVMVACSSDNSTDTRTEPIVGKARVTLRLVTGEENAVTRAWQDGNAKTDQSEMMYNWTVLITDGSAIKYKYSGTPEEAEAEIDNVCTDVEMEAGTYSVYSFANISEASLKTLLGISSLDGGTALADATVAAATATVNGNSFDPTADNANGFGCKGIPMSNKQSLTVPSSGSISKDLIVVRMLAKMELRITNSTGADVTVKKITLTDVTANEADNLKLLPSLTTAANADDMEAHHQDVRPNLNNTPTTTDFVVLSTDKAIANGSTENVTFYVNESATPANNGGLFQLSLELDGGEYRYSLISNNAQYEWNYIARNDYRVLPVVLDDYKFELIPYDFPPIGVYPCSVKELDATENLYEMTFHDYGHFHLVPQVTKRSDGSTVPYGSTGGTSPYWTLDTDWATSFKTAATKGGAWLTASEVEANGFYVSGSTATTDADDNGGVPVFDATTVWNGFTPFIFGKIAEPDAAWWTSPTDKQIYHEMRVKLYVNGTYRRDMIYRFYMTLSADQLLSAPQLRFAPRRSHRP